MDFYGNYNKPYNNYNQMQNNAYNGNYQPQIRTNKIFVTSLEDALNRYAEPNTVMVYRHQDEKFEYEIMTDAQGKKSYKTFVLGDYLATQGEKTDEPITKLNEDIKRLEGRIKGLEDEILKKYKKEKSGGAD